MPSYVSILGLVRRKQKYKFTYILFDLTPPS